MAEFKVESMQKALLSGRVNELAEDESMASARRFFSGLTRGHEVEVDLSALQSAGSIALSLLLCVLRLAERQGCSVVYSNLSGDLYDVARVGGLDSVLPIKHA